jgi:hypothetical protein
MSISARVNENLKVLMPKIRQQVAQRTSSVPFIDLGTAENWLIRDEIAVFFRDVFRDGFSLDVRFPQSRAVLLSSAYQ